MDSKLHSLPPMKRFTLHHHHHHEPRPKLDSTTIPPSHLPTKKRKQTENFPSTPYCLPAKKRVWAVPPVSNPLSTIDLNVEYVPSPEKKLSSPHRLPAKKRVWAPRPESPSPKKTPFPPNLPAKKRVWAVRPESPSPKKTPFLPNLPAKKRIWAVRPEPKTPSPEKKIFPPNSPRCLPAKKRVWAAQPETLSPEKKKLQPNSPCCLPAKKRVWEVRPESPSPEKKKLPSNSVICLPAKKRVSAIEPESLSPQKKKIQPNSVICLPAKKQPESLSPEKKVFPPNSVDCLPVEKEEEDDKEEDDDDENDGVECAVCTSTDADSKDPIVFCDGCDLMVHTTCYGNPLTKSIPEGDWLCQKCECKHDNNNNNDDDDDNKSDCCCLCPVIGGALKRTNDGRWAHIGCAVLVPEVFFEDSVGRDGIDLSLVPGKRWKGVCYLCGSKKGCVVECSEPRCMLSFHVGCGLKEELCIELIEKRTTTTTKRNTKSNCSGVVAAFCRKHTDIWDKQQQTGKFKIVARDEQ